MYRAVSLYLEENQIPFGSDSPGVKQALADIYIEQKLHPTELGTHTFLNGEDVESKLRTQGISQIVSQVSTLKSVREEMVAQQQRMGKGKGVVMDGRDIGTVVFPNADLKVFMIADLKIRAVRRQNEFAQRGMFVPLEEILENLKHRDHLDSTREIGPLKQAPDAKVIDTTHITIDEQVAIVCDLAQQILDS